LVPTSVGHQLVLPMMRRLELQAELEPPERLGLPGGVEWTPGWVRSHQVTVSRSIYIRISIYITEYQ